MKTVDWKRLDADARRSLLARPRLETDAELRATVAEILAVVRARGDQAVAEYSQRFDGIRPGTPVFDPADLDPPELPADLLAAIERAIETVTAFHAAGRPRDLEIETAPGVTCAARWLPLEPVGLYVPAGTAPLPSTAIMLGVPARLAGCGDITLTTPPGPDGRPDPAVLAVARKLEIRRMLIAGGAQAIAALGYGTDSVPRCVKLFGPGNRFVTEAKRQLAETADGAAMDLPAGPSEVMVIADARATPTFIATDLLSQAEHGPDSQVFLVTDDPALPVRVAAAMERELADLPRADTARAALAHGATILVSGPDQAADVANAYAPEHLILAVADPESLCAAITTAGSVFLGDYTPETLGDYISGTNHVLPTGGWARSTSGLSLSDFMRRMTVQRATPAGLAELGSHAARLAAHERLDAHRRAVTARLEAMP